MKKEIGNRLKNNWFFLILLVGIICIFVKRYTYLPVSVVSNPNSQIAFCTTDVTLEQTWQPEIKAITGIQVPYYAENDFSCDIQLKVFSDDYTQVLVEAMQENYVFAAGTTGNVEFSFDRTAVIQGERYRIQISLLNADSEGTLQIASGSNYGGCMVAGEEMNQAAALKITFVKYSKLFWLMAVWLPLLGISLFLMTLTDRKWEETVGVSILLEGIILYIFGLFEHLTLGVTTVYVLTTLCFVAAIFLYNKKSMTLRNLLSPGFFLYCALFLVILITSSGDWLGYRDEMRHWGIAVRDMFYYDSFAKHSGTTLILPRYLPFAALIEYLFVYMNGLFSEDILFIAYQTFALSMLIILCRPLQKKSGRKLLIPVLVTMICIPVIFFHNISNTIMVDSLLAAVSAYVLLCYYGEEMTWFNRMRIILGLIAMPLIKDMGLVFAGLTALIMFGDTLARQIKEKKFRIKEPACVAGYVVLIMIAYFSWQFYFNMPVQSASETAEVNEIVEEAEDTEILQEESVPPAIEEESASIGGITIDGLIRVLSGEGEEYQYQVTRNFLTELFEGETYSFGLFKISFFDWMALLIFGILTFSYFGCWKEDKVRMVTLAGVSLVAACLLCAFLQVTYWFTFSRYEALELTSMDRYLAPFACAITIVVFYLACVAVFREQDGNRKKKYLIFAIAAFFAVSMPVEGIVTEGKDIEGNTTDVITYGHDSLTEILRSVAKRGERAYFICSNSDGYTEYVFRNAV
ncbi:MAG: hypothetical protein SOX45_07115, partial [Lachnospiraceae bacterium]|nr:hypothetical protein [Lachnospiraceae bacterium]